MWMNDLRLAVRVLLKRPGFTGTVVLTLALGVGATTALFGVFRGVFLEPFPLPDSDELVIVMEAGSFGCCGPASGPDFVDWVARERSFEGMAALSPGVVTLTGLDEPERVYATEVTASAFDFLGVEPLMGRALRPDDQVTEDVVLLSYELWQRVLAGRSDVVGQGLEVDGRVRTIAGVMPRGFEVPSPWLGTRRHELYLPLPLEELESNRGDHGLPVIARIDDGVDLETAQADMDRIMRELAAEYPETNEMRTAQVFTVHEYLYGDVGGQLLLILGAAGLVLLIACGNVAGLQLARGAGREAELAVRSALGASRATIVRLLFSESLALAALGGGLGIGVAYLSLDALKGVLPASIPRVDEVAIDSAALAFALGAAVLTALAFGMLPALLAARTDVASGVREGGRGMLVSSKERARDLFIVAQIAIGLVLANGAGLLVRSYSELRGQAYGFETDGVLAVALNPSGPRYEDGASLQRYYEQVIDRTRQVPGVRSVGMVSRLPLAGGTNGNVQVEGWEPRSSTGQGPLVEFVSVVGEYHDAMGIPLLQGRLLVPDDSIADAS
jgi:predicted permease